MRSLESSETPVLNRGRTASKRSRMCTTIPVLPLCAIMTVHMVNFTFNVEGAIT